MLVFSTVIMRSTLVAVKSGPKRLDGNLIADVQSKMKAAASSGGSRPQSAPADSVEGLAAEASLCPVQGHTSQAAPAGC